MKLPLVHWHHGSRPLLRQAVAFSISAVVLAVIWLSLVVRGFNRTALTAPLSLFNWRKNITLNSEGASRMAFCQTSQCRLVAISMGFFAARF